MTVARWYNVLIGRESPVLVRPNIVGSIRIHPILRVSDELWTTMPHQERSFLEMYHAQAYPIWEKNIWVYVWWPLLPFAKLYGWLSYRRFVA